LDDDVAHFSAQGITMVPKLGNRMAIS